jgi:ABC-type glycerol-3-phosphate transport system substrate-binding protein
VNAVNRRKSALLFLLLFLTILILTPWASAPSPAKPSDPKPDHGPAAAVVPEVEAKVLHIKVAAALNVAEFQFLESENRRLADRLPDIAAELVRVPPASAYDEFRHTLQLGEAADVMLLENEWVKQFAASGYLLPADSAFVGEALAEQFDALSSPVKWNDYLWAVPRDFDPYVMVWNVSVLHALLGDTAVTPLGPAQWAVLAQKNRESGQNLSWLTIDGRDAMALLAWLETVSGERTDTLWNDTAKTWTGTGKGQALALLDAERPGVSFAQGSSEAALHIAAGKSAAAVLPYSEALKLTVPSPNPGAMNLVMDVSAWSLPYHWPRGRSYAVASRTAEPDAARRWIALMTEAEVQQANELAFGKLPVYRSLYGNDSSLASLFPGGGASAFPHSASEEYGPELPIRLERLGRLWREWVDGRVTLQEWVRLWPETASSDFELHD